MLRNADTHAADVMVSEVKSDTNGMYAYRKVRVPHSSTSRSRGIVECVRERGEREQGLRWCFLHRALVFEFASVLWFVFNLCVGRTKGGTEEPGRRVLRVSFALGLCRALRHAKGT